MAIWSKKNPKSEAAQVPDTEESKSERSDRPVKSTGLSEAQIAALRGRQLAADFGNLVTVLMQSPHHKHMSLGSLKSRLVPPLMARQFRIAEVGSEASGKTVPVGLILWASVSDEVDRRLRANLDRSFALSAEEWTSGPHLWIIDAVGPERFLAPILTDLRKRVFEGRTVNVRIRDGEGGASVRTLADLIGAKRSAPKMPDASVAASANGVKKPTRSADSRLN